MVKVVPIKAIRAVPEYAPIFSSDSYERLEVLPRQDENIITYKDILFPEDILDEGEDSNFDLSKKILNKLLEDKLLFREKEPSIYVYRQEKDGHGFTGFIAGASIDDYNNNFIRKHELTRNQKEDEIAQYFTELKINGSPVLLTYPEDKELSLLLEKTTLEDAEYSFSDHGIQHQLWRLTGKHDIEFIQQKFRDMECLYIADGHHRCAAYARVWEQLPSINGKRYMMSFIIPDNSLKLYSYNRLLLSLSGMKKDKLLKALENNFEITKIPADSYSPPAEGYIGLYMDGSWYELKIRLDLKENRDVKDSLDVQILEKYILKDILNITDSRTNKNIMFSEGSSRNSILKNKVDDGTAEAAFVLYPVNIHDVFAISDAGETMPPKSTWIEPKLRSGLVIHVIDEV